MVVGAPQVHLGIPSAIWNLWKESTHQNHLKTKGCRNIDAAAYQFLIADLDRLAAGYDEAGVDIFS